MPDGRHHPDPLTRIQAWISQHAHERLVRITGAKSKGLRRRASMNSACAAAPGETGPLGRAGPANSSNSPATTASGAKKSSRSSTASPDLRAARRGMCTGLDQARYGSPSSRCPSRLATGPMRTGEDLRPWKP